MDFLDIPGASGARYRYRHSTVAELPATAGNVVAVVGASAKRRYLLCGATRSLNRARPTLEAVLRDNPAAEVFIRLNVARAARDAEHADIVASMKPEVELPDLE